LLERLASGVLAAGRVDCVAQIYDQYMNYVALEDNLFSCRVPRCLLLHSESELMVATERIGDALFSVLMTLSGSVPLLSRLAADSESSLTARALYKLESRLKSHLINTKSSMSMSLDESAGACNTRPLLLVVDRSFDWGGPIKHSSNYNALIDEVLGLEANRIVVPEAGKKSVTFDVDMRDWFWRENASRPFPTVAENVEAALKAYKSEYDRVLQTTPGMTEEMMKQGASHDGPSLSTTSKSALNPEQLRVAISVLPDLADRKRLIDSHLQISTALLDAIKTRDLGELFHVEQSIATTPPAQLVAMLQSPKLGSPVDKLRLLIVVWLHFQATGKQMPALSEMMQTVREALGRRPDTDKLYRAFEYIQEHVQRTTLLASPTALIANPNVSTNLSTNTTDFLSRLAGGASTTSSLLGSLVASVKNMLPVAVQDSPLTQLLDQAYNVASQQMPSSSGAASPVKSAPGSPVAGPLKFTVLDPRPRQALVQEPSTLYAIDHVVLVVLGGVSYAEYDDLLAHFAKPRMQHLKLTVGVTEMTNATKLLHQLSELK